jgi:inner membrane protein
MNKSFITKIIGMLALITLMAFAVSYINNIILERQRNQTSVQQEIARSSVHSQQILGPVLAVPYVEEYTDYINEFNQKGEKTLKPITKRNASIIYFLPENIKLGGQFDNDYKKRGIYKALMFQLHGNITGNFRLPPNLDITPEHKDGIIKFDPAYIGFGISDTRGINGKPIFNFSNKSYKFKQGSNIKTLGNGIHALVGNVNSTIEQSLPFEFKINLRGMERFSFTPLAENNNITLQSRWQHPSFNGSFLPISKEISASGFSGNWSISSLSSSNQAHFNKALYNNEQPNRNLETLAINFIEPINVYSQADRATKYGLLFIGLTFIGFFLFEVLKQLRIHPAQYTLVGLAMAMFYLLLVSFAEVIGFAYAYLSASASCILLLGYYLSYVLKSKANGFTFAGFLTALYGALYGILASEDNALIMGSLLVFGLLAVTMVITRKVDWYALSPQK